MLGNTKQMAMDSNASTLPEEIITIILKRLPVKSLIRFQCVCKHWRNFIKNPFFIADHLHACHQCPSLLFQRNRLHPLELCLLNWEMQVQKVQEAPLSDSLDCARIDGSSNGLLCVTINKSVSPPSFLLWNPAIREIRQISSAIGDYEGEYFIGFGFSLIINDYRVVMICLPKYYKDGFRVEVYSLTSGTWKGVECGMLEGIDIRSKGVTANGAMFWICLGSKCEIMILSFDIAREVFKLIPTPHASSNPLWSVIFYENNFKLFPTPDASSNPLWSVFVYENKLAMLYETTTKKSESRVIHLWVMEDDVGSCSKRWNWTKKYTSIPFSRSIRPVTIWKNEIVCNVSGHVREAEHGRVNSQPNIALLNPSTSEFKMFDVHACNTLGIDYVESLVPVGGKKISAIFM